MLITPSSNVLLPRVSRIGARRSRKGRPRDTVVILALCAALVWSLCMNMQVWSAVRYPQVAHAQEGSSDVSVHPRPDLRNLILVACHAVFVGSDYTKAEHTESWLLLDYQKVPGQAHSFIEHIQEGITHAEQDDTALLLFSGGQTRKAAGPRSEGEGYWLVAEAAAWWGHAYVRDRAFTEEHARDSFENLLFSLCRFYELTGHYPDEVLVISYDFKHERFADLHRAALQWPDSRFRFLGTPALTLDAEQGEHGVLEAFRQDPFGCKGNLAMKKYDRDPFAVGPYSSSRCTGLESLLTRCEQATKPWSSTPDVVPWSSAR